MTDKGNVIPPMSLPKPYYDHAGITIYHGDCRKILPSIGGCDAIITDPVWPNAKAKLAGCDRPFDLLKETLISVTNTRRIVLQLGCDSDPRFLAAVPERWPFFRVIWLEYACPTRKGRLLYTGDVGYVFGLPPRSAPGRRVMPGRFISTRTDNKRMAINKHREFGRAVTGSHPCPRRLQHVQYLIAKWADGLVIDPFTGSGTTLLAAKQQSLHAIGIEIEERYCEIAANRLEQEVFTFAVAPAKQSDRESRTLFD